MQIYKCQLGVSRTYFFSLHVSPSSSTADRITHNLPGHTLLSQVQPRHMRHKCFRILQLAERVMSFVCKLLVAAMTWEASSYQHCYHRLPWKINDHHIQLRVWVLATIDDTSKINIYKYFVVFPIDTKDAAE